MINIEELVQAGQNSSKDYFIWMKEMKENHVPSFKSADMFFSGHQVTSVGPIILILHEGTSAATHYKETTCVS